MEKTWTGEIVERDGELELWDLGYEGGLWWARRGDKQVPLLAEEQRRGVYDHLDYAIRRGDVVIDGGANIGTFAKKCLKAGAVVTCVEPDYTVCHALERNLSLFDPDIIPRCLSDRSGLDCKLSIKTDESGASSVELPRGDQTQMVRSITIDEICETKSQVDFIKLDIEGAEENALFGARKTLQRCHPRLIVATEHRADDNTRLRDVIHRMAPAYKFLDLDSKGMPGSAFLAVWA